MVTLLLWFHLIRRLAVPLAPAAAVLLCAANPTFLRYGNAASALAALQRLIAAL